uniref:ribonuclease H n=1 Tax=Hippocampus comes TaxID=109280 RepID=A0A3Q2YAJ9_HIPCM
MYRIQRDKQKEEQGLEPESLQQGQAVTELRGAVSMLAHRFDYLEPRLTQLKGRRAPTTEVPVHLPTFGREPMLPHPPRYGGEHGQCGHFLHQCSFVFDQQPSVYVNDNAKVAYVMSLLTGQAASWAISVSEAQPNLRSSFPDFVTALRRVFHHPVRGREAEGRLLELRQGKQSVADYSIEFRILAAQSGYEDRALCGLFRRGLNSLLKDELRNREPRCAAPGEEPMQLGGGSTRTAERRRCLDDRLCPKCGLQGHRAASCPSEPQPPTPFDYCESRPRAETQDPRRVDSRPGHPRRLELEGEIYGASRTRQIRALIDSGSDDCFLDTDIASELGCLVEELTERKRVHDLDGRLLAVVTQITETLKLRLSGNHVEHRRFYLMHSRAIPVILGLPWLKTHNPVISWERPAIEVWSPFFYQSWFLEAICLDGVPSCYHDLQQVFSKDRVRSLPPHRPYDCAIDLQVGAPLPSSRLHQVSHPEQEALREYINSSLAAGLIRPSRSPLGAGFFFVEKKDKSLRPCVDYRGLNDITIKNKYPLPLLDSAFAPLQSATIFSKLDLRSAYHLVRVREGDEWKTALRHHWAILSI